MDKINMKSKKKIIIICLLILIITVIAGDAIVRNIDKFNIGKTKAENLENASYVIYDFQNNIGKMLVTFKDEENGINKIEFPNSENTLECNGKNQVSFDYEIEKDKTYDFKLTSVSGEEKRISATIDENFLFNNGINFEEIESETVGIRRIKLNYMQEFDRNFRNYYKIGENGTWTEYNNEIELKDSDIVQNKLYNNEDATVTLYAKATNSKNNCEIELKQRYSMKTSGDGIIQVLGKENITEETTKINVLSNEYSVHVYEYDGNQTWTEDMVFGNENDVATVTENAKNMVIVKVNGDLTIENRGYCNSICK